MERAMRLLNITLVLSLVGGWAAFAQAPQGANPRLDRREGNLNSGDAAPDFELKKLRSGERVRLSAFRNKKPVALIFGSYT